MLYKSCFSVAKKLDINLKDLQKSQFSQIVEAKLASINLASLSEDFDTDISTMELIINAFKQKSYEDNVISFSKPIYSMSIQTPDEIKEGMTLTGNYHLSVNIFFIPIKRNT